jgi:hypothetical protein
LRLLYLSKEALEGYGDFKIEQKILTYDLLQLAKEEIMLQGMTDRQITETRRCYGIEMNVEKTKVIRISGDP